jgi:hypothetical protein
MGWSIKGAFVEVGQEVMIRMRAEATVVAGGG